VRVYQFRHIRVPWGKRRYRTCAAPLVEALSSAAAAPARLNGRVGFASLVAAQRAAIVQGTRTPPSHGGNPGSNPGSGTPTPPPILGGVEPAEGRSPRPRGGDPNAKMLRLVFTPGEWRELRLRAAQDGSDVERIVAAIVRRELENRSRKAL
jgi:hypothetical protein